MRIPQITCVHEAHAGCGEGPVWDHRSGMLWWVDIAGEAIYAHDPSTQRNQRFQAPYLISSLVLAPDGLLVATAKGIARLNQSTGEITPFADPEPNIAGNRLNDIIAAPDGALWAGTMSEGAKGPTGALYRYGDDGLQTMMTGTTISNGLGWSPDGQTLYFIDSVPGILYARQDGTWRELRRFDTSTGKPDGMCVDSTGMLWIAICDQGAVIGMTPDGIITHRIEMPCQIVTSCAFGGSDLKTLFVTTGTFSMTAEEKAANPLAGGLFAINLETAGLQSFEARWPRQT